VKVAIVIGGAELVWEELAKARELCVAAGAEVTFFATNDMIQLFPEHAIAVTLHPDKLASWLAKRRASNYPNPEQIWAHRSHRYATKESKDWGGSVGLFAPKIAHWELGFGKVILCGVPMLTASNHFVRHQKWIACKAFQGSWTEHLAEIAPFFRSMSGWTAEKLGNPTLEWLNG
jgi:hypothetical protein